MLLKAGVDISRLNRETRRALGKVGVLFVELGEEIVITSTYEGDHGPGSLHYANAAFDVRYPVIPTIGIIGRIRVKLGRDFDIVSEGDHIHIENDPKGV